MTPIYIRPFPRVIVQEQDGHDLRLNVPNEIGLPNIEVEEAFLAIRGQNIGAAIELRQRLAIEARILAFTAARAQMRRDLETIRRLEDATETNVQNTRRHDQPENSRTTRDAQDQPAP